MIVTDYASIAQRMARLHQDLAVAEFALPPGVHIVQSADLGSNVRGGNCLWFFLDASECRLYMLPHRTERLDGALGSRFVGALMQRFPTTRLIGSEEIQLAKAECQQLIAILANDR